MPDVKPMPNPVPRTEEFSVRSRDSSGPASILDISGRLGRSGEDILPQAFREAAGKSRNIVLNFSGLQHIDPEGITLLVLETVRAARQKVSVSAWGASDPLRGVFRLTRVDEAIRMAHDEKGALSADHSQRKIYRPDFSVRSGPPVKGWAKAADHVHTPDIPCEAMNLNVEGRRRTSPGNGFGRCWDKKYILRIPGAQPAPEEVASFWRSEFEEFLPEGNHFFLSGGRAAAPGMTAVLNLRFPGGLVMATGFMVIYVDETSFSFMAVQGHIISGWITFSTFRENSGTALQVHATFRAADPFMEVAFRLGAAKGGDRFWREALAKLARRLGVYGIFEKQALLVDPLLQWEQMQNLWYNGAIRSFLYLPIYRLKRISCSRGGSPFTSRPEKADLRERKNTAPSF